MPDDLPRRQRLADLYVGSDPKHYATAVLHHQEVLRRDKQRLASYEALRTLYKRTDQLEKARACDEAIAILGKRLVDAKIEALFTRAMTDRGERAAGRVLSNADWHTLAMHDVDPLLSSLFALVAPAFAVERARTKPPPAWPSKPAELPRALARVLDQVAAVYGIAQAPALVDRELAAPCILAMRTREQTAAPVLVFGRPAADTMIDADELAFAVARQLADLRSDRIARLLCPRPAELAQMLELAATPARIGSSWLAGALNSIERDTVKTLGARWLARGHDPLRAATEWLATTDRTADRIGYVVVGELASCVRVLEREPHDAARRVGELVWASITEEVFAVRARVDGWVDVPARL